MNIPNQSQLEISAQCDVQPAMMTLHYFDEGNTLCTVPDKTAILDAESREYISTMSNVSANNLRTYRQFVDMLNEGLRSTDKLDLDNIEVNDVLTDNGGKFHRMVTFNNETIKFNQDTIKLRLWCWTAYNLRWSEQFIFAPIISYCLNGCFSAAWFIRSMSKKNWQNKAHLQSKDITSALSTFQAYPEWFETMAKKQVNQVDVGLLFEQTLAKVDRDLVKTISDYTLKELDKHWGSYKRRYGSNMYAVYQTATHWATHPEGRGNPHNKLRTRSMKVTDMLGSQEWHTLLAA